MVVIPVINFRITTKRFMLLLAHFIGSKKQPSPLCSDVSTTAINTGDSDKNIQLLLKVHLILTTA